MISWLILPLVSLAMLIALGAAALAWVLTHPPRRTAGQVIAHGLPADPSDLDALYETATEQIGRRPIDLWIVEGAQDQGPPIIMLHGWGDSRMGCLLWLDVVRPAASKLVLYDQRGHGESPHRRCTCGVLEAADAAEVAAWAARRWPNAPIVLLGHSMGAVAAIRAAAEQSADLPIVAVIADSPWRRLGGTVRRMLQSQRLPARPIADLALLTLWLWRRPTVADDTAALAARLRTPLLVIAGDADPYVDVQDASAVASAAAHGELAIFKQSQHVQAACSDPESYRRLIADFCAKLTATAATTPQSKHR